MQNKSTVKSKAEPAIAAPMTADQAAELKKLAHDAYDLEAFHPRLTQAQAQTRIVSLHAKLKLQDGPPHTL
jgi:hypothetical protein